MECGEEDRVECSSNSNRSNSKTRGGGDDTTIKYVTAAAGTIEEYFLPRGEWSGVRRGGQSRVQQQSSSSNRSNSKTRGGGGLIQQSNM